MYPHIKKYISLCSQWHAMLLPSVYMPNTKITFTSLGYWNNVVNKIT